GCLLLVASCLSVSLNLLNISLPSWMSSLAPFLPILCAVLLLVEALKAPTPVKAWDRRAFLSLSVLTLGLLTLGNFVQRARQLSQLRIGRSVGDLPSYDMRQLENALSSRLGIPVSPTVFGQTYADTINALGMGDG